MMSTLRDYLPKWWLKKLENFTARDEARPRQPGDHLNAQIPLDPAASRATNPKPKPRDKISQPSLVPQLLLYAGIIFCYEIMFAFQIDVSFLCSNRFEL